MTIAVDLGGKATQQTAKQTKINLICFNLVQALILSKNKMNPLRVGVTINEKRTFIFQKWSLCQVLG